MSGRARRHHYVPQTLQKRFLNDHGQIWYSSRSHHSIAFSHIESRNPRSCFQERDFFTVLDEEDKRSDYVERHFYGTVDDHLGKLLDEVGEIIERGEVPRFLGQPLTSMHHLFVALYKRSKDITLKYDDEYTGNEIISRTLDAAETELGISRGEYQRQMKFPAAKDLGRNARVYAQTAEPNEILDVLAEYQAVFVKAEVKSSFVLGSRMVYRISNGTNDKLGSPNVELWMPIGPSTAIVLAHRSRPYPEFVIWKKEWVRQVNEYICSACLGVASHSDRLLRSLLGQR